MTITIGITTRIAILDDIDAVAPLFADYRVFYAQSHDLDAAREFLHARLSQNESTVILAYIDGDSKPVGFTQLYPMFSSVRAARTYILNDLYVADTTRRQGVGEALLHAAAEFGRNRGAIRLELETSPDNLTAQSLYRAQGWAFYQGSFRFHLPLVAVSADE
jgi:ribosomal protein S18 acetylase RimI-like enzyme